MRWFKPNFKDYFLALMGPGEDAPSTLQGQIEEIRQLILDELGESAQTSHPQTVLRVRYAQDAQALWYVRGDVMAVLAAMHGETVAREIIAHISNRFKGLLPRGLSSRPSPLTQ